MNTDELEQLNGAAPVADKNSNPVATAVAPSGNGGTETQQPLLASDAGGAEKAVERKPAPGLGGKLRKLFGGSDGACTCGRKAGVQGRHKKDCALNSNNGKAHFDAPDLSKPDALPEIPSAGVPQIPVAPVDYSYWGSLAETSMRLRLKVQGWWTKRKNLPTLTKALGEEKGLREATALGAEFETCVPAEDIKKLSEKAIKCAEFYQVKSPHAPAWDLALTYLSIEGHIWAAGSRNDIRLANIEALVRQSIAQNQKPAQPNAEAL